MNVVEKYPPNYKKLCEFFPIKGLTNIVFTYGDALYNPGGGEITPDLFAHEETHTVQQNEMGIEKWWEKYCVDREFRLSQEVGAYQNQYKYALENYSRPQRRELLKRISGDFASPIYGDLISKKEARDLIKQKHDN